MASPIPIRLLVGSSVRLDRSRAALESAEHDGEAVASPVIRAHGLFLVRHITTNQETASWGGVGAAPLTFSCATVRRARLTGGG
jgi:hypothetical protein